MPFPGDSEINIVDECAKCKTAPCDPVIGDDRQVYRNEHCAKCLRVTPVANAVDRSICGPEIFNDIIKWIKENPTVALVAVIVALLLLRR